MNLPAVVLTREPADQADLVLRLRSLGVPVREVPCVATRFLETAQPDRTVALAFGSRRGVAGLLAQAWGADVLREAPLVGAVGPATARALEAAGRPPDLVADPPRGEILARDLAARLPPGGVVTVVRGDLAGPGLEPGLAAAGLVARPVVVYHNTSPSLEGLDPSPAAAVFVASPSAARRLLDAFPGLRTLPWVAVGPTTGQACRELGVLDVREAGTDPDAIADALFRAWRAQAAPHPPPEHP